MSELCCSRPSGACHRPRGLGGRQSCATATRRVRQSVASAFRARWSASWRAGCPSRSWRVPCCWSCPIRPRPWVRSRRWCCSQLGPDRRRSGPPAPLDLGGRGGHARFPRRPGLPGPGDPRRAPPRGRLRGAPPCRLDDRRSSRRAPRPELRRAAEPQPDGESGLAAARRRAIPRCDPDALVRGVSRRSVVVRRGDRSSGSRTVQPRPARSDSGSSGARLGLVPSACVHRSRCPGPRGRSAGGATESFTRWMPSHDGTLS